MDSSSFRNIQSQLSKLTNRVKDIDIDDLTNLDHIKDNPDALSLEIVRQPSLFAYYYNLKRIADAQYDKLSETMDNFKASKLKTIMEMLKLDKISHPTSKLIDIKFIEICSKNELYVKCLENLKIWEQRKEVIGIALKVVESRESSFKCLSYMMDSLIKTGLMYPSKRKTLTVGE
jgi:hypothetical protein